MASDSTTRWPLLDERAPFATASHGGRARRTPRSVWLLTGLAFLCGGLVSAAGFSIGWRHQAQRDTAAQSALAAVNARVRRLEGRIVTSLATARSATAHAAAASATERSLARAAANVATEAGAAGGDAASISSGAGSLTAETSRVASELKTLDTYLTTTPAGQLDPGYIASQTSYLSRQLAHVQGDAGNLGGSAASLETTVRRLSRDASALKSH